MNYDKIFTGEKEEFQLASGYISQTTVLFEKEGVYAKIEAKGEVEFFSLNNSSLGKITLPKQTGGREVYTDLVCQKEGENLILKFPVVEWIDNYPNCDGEYDRWETRTIGYETLTFNTAAGKLTLN